MKYSSSTYPCVARSIVEALNAFPPSLVTDGGAVALRIQDAKTSSMQTSRRAGLPVAGPERPCLLADKVSRFIGASCSFVRRRSRIGAQRTRTDGCPIGLRCWNPRWRRLRRHPFVDRRHHVERRRAVAAPAVVHTRHHEEAHAFVRVLRHLQHALVVVDRIRRRNAWVAPAMVDE